MSSSKAKNTKKPSKFRQSDPFYERECQKYDFPLPSREFITQVLTERGVPLPFGELADATGLSLPQIDRAHRRIHGMSPKQLLIRARLDEAMRLCLEMTRRMGEKMGKAFTRHGPADLAGLKDAFLGGIIEGEALFAPPSSRVSR